MNTAEGSCVCGAVRYRIEREGAPIAFQYCHCSRCRKKSGSAHAANVFVAVDELVWLTGEDEVARFDLESAKYWSTCFCKRCGSAMPWKTRTGKAWVVPAGSLDDDTGAKPTRNIYFGSRAHWYEHAKDLQMHDEYPK